MLTMTFSKNHNEPLNILCLGAHADDIEIGCGGTILKLIHHYNKNVNIVWIVFSAIEERAQEARCSADAFLEGVHNKRILTYQYRDGFFPSNIGDIKDRFEALKKEFFPDIIFTHFRDDRHQDHRSISDLTWNTFRNHLILEYEIPKYDGDFGTPNFFMQLDEEVCNTRNGYIIKYFQTQKEKHWLTDDTLRAVLRLRGIESGRSSRYAEGFYCRKMTF